MLISIAIDNLNAQQVHPDTSKLFSLSKLSLTSYGTMVYQNFQWQTFPEKNNSIDNERLVIEPEYAFTEKLSLELEIEFEHGGTGVTMEFDNEEEFGEFEIEVEKGGEVKLEEMLLSYQVNSHLFVKAGRIPVPIGLVTANFKPSDYFSTTYNSVEAVVLPTKWYENGFGIEAIFGNNNQFHADALIVNGLDASGFSSANWILNGYQLKFETVSADNFAFAGRFDYQLPNSSSKIGLSGYYGNSAGNRPKPDLNVNAFVGIYDAHAEIEWKALTFRTLFLYGTLSNADKVSDANRNLSNNLNVKRTPVGSAYLGYYLEAGYDVLSFFAVKKSALNIFGGYYYYDTMAEVTGDVFDNVRWKRNELRGGFQYIFNDQISAKADYSHRTLGIPDDNVEDTYTVGFGFQF
ncbi:MAG: hypothetical protein ABIO46_06050 [Chitinophagales bacterium]